MLRLVVSLDALAAFRSAAGVTEPRLVAAASLVELAGADAVRVSLTEDVGPVREEDVHDLRRAVGCLELRMPPSVGLVKVALKVRPNLAVLAAPAAGNGELGAQAVRAVAAPVAAALREGGVAVAARVETDPEAVKAAHAAQLTGVEFWTGATVALRSRVQRRTALERLDGMVRMASKLGLTVAAGGGLDLRGVGWLVDSVPAVESVIVGRRLVARALLIGMERAVRDLRAELA